MPKPYLGPSRDLPLRLQDYDRQLRALTAQVAQIRPTIYTGNWWDSDGWGYGSSTHVPIPTSPSDGSPLGVSVVLDAGQDTSGNPVAAAWVQYGANIANGAYASASTNAYAALTVNGNTAGDEVGPPLAVGFGGENDGIIASVSQGFMVGVSQPARTPSPSTPG